MQRYCTTESQRNMSEDVERRSRISRMRIKLYLNLWLEAGPTEPVEEGEAANKLKGDNKEPWKEQMKMPYYLKGFLLSSVL